jgi:hypothetical protein
MEANSSIFEWIDCGLYRSGVSLHVLFFGIEAVFQLKLKNLFLAFAHLVVEGLECGFKHADGGLE